MPVDTSGDEFSLFLGFCRGLSGLTAFRTEWAIFADEENLAGSIDFIAVDRASSESTLFATPSSLVDVRVSSSSHQLRISGVQNNVDPWSAHE